MSTGTSSGTDSSFPWRCLLPSHLMTGSVLTTNLVTVASVMNYQLWTWFSGLFFVLLLGAQSPSLTPCSTHSSCGCETHPRPHHHALCWAAALGPQSHTQHSEEGTAGPQPCPDFSVSEKHDILYSPVLPAGFFI